MIYIYFSPWDDEYFLSRIEIKDGFRLEKIVQNEKGVYKMFKGLGAKIEQVDKMFEILNKEVK